MMNSLILLSLLAGVFSYPTPDSQPVQQSGPGYVRLPFIAHKRDDNGNFQKHNFDTADYSRLKKRDGGNYPVKLTNNNTLTYQVQLTLGGQPFSVQLDTGSSDLWVYSSKNPYCEASTSKREVQEREIADDYADEKLDDDFNSEIESEFGFTTDSEPSTVLTAAQTTAQTAAQTTVASTAASTSSSSSASGSTSSSASSSASSSSTVPTTSSASAGPAFRTGTQTVPTGSNDYPSFYLPDDISYSKTVTMHTSALPAQVSAVVDCSTLAFYDPSKSSNYTNLHDEFYISYMDNTFAQGVASSDTLVLGNYTLHDFRFFLADAGNSSDYVFGIGPWSSESSAKGYNNLPLALYAAKQISRVLYSVYLNDISAASGEILFGAIDYGKFEGQLALLPINNYANELSPDSLAVTLSGISLNNSKGSTSALVTARKAVVLDTGSSQTYLPDYAFSQLGAAELFYDTDIESYIYNCGKIKDYSLVFNFTGSVFNIPLSTFGQNLTQYNDQVLKGKGDKTLSKYCVLNISPSTDDSITLGDSFLRYFYVVYDLERLQIGLAKAVLNSTIEDLFPISAELPGIMSPYGSAQYQDNVTADGADPSGTVSSYPTNKAVLNGAAQLKAIASPLLAVVLSMVLGFLVAA